MSNPEYLDREESDLINLAARLTKSIPLTEEDSRFSNRDIGGDTNEIDEEEKELIRLAYKLVTETDSYKELKVAAFYSTKNETSNDESLDELYVVFYALDRTYIRNRYGLSDLETDIAIDEAFEATLRRRKKDNSIHLKEYFNMALHRQAYSWRGQRKRPIVGPIDSHFYTAQSTSQPEQLVIAKEFVEKLSKTLTEYEITLFKMHFEEGLSKQEIAKAMKSSAGAVQNGIKRILAKTRKLRKENNL